MQLPFFQVDAFTGRPFTGNPAAVVLVYDWPDDDVMQAIAAENNLSETAFVQPPGDDGRRPLRWFTPVTEVDLCGHATLATARVLFDREGGTGELVFATASGDLVVHREGDALRMDLPARPPSPVEAPAGLAEALGAEPVEVQAAVDLLVRLDDAEAVRELEPDLAALLDLSWRGVIVTAPGAEVDVVSRFFAPGVGVPEDPVTGSAHCTLAPYWAEELGRPTLTARQLSPRGGALTCEVHDDRVHLLARAVVVIDGTLHLDRGLP